MAVYGAALERLCCRAAFFYAVFKGKRPPFPASSFSDHRTGIPGVFSLWFAAMDSWRCFSWPGAPFWQFL